MKKKRKPEYPEKTPATGFRKYHILKPEDSSPKRDSRPRNSNGDKHGKQTCKPLHRPSPLEETAANVIIHHAAFCREKYLHSTVVVVCVAVCSFARFFLRFGWLVGWLVRSVGRLVARWVSYLVYWLIGWLIIWIVHFFVCLSVIFVG